MKNKNNLDDLIGSKSFREINNQYKKCEYLPGLYTEDDFEDIESLVKRKVISYLPIKNYDKDYDESYFVDSNNFEDELYNAGFVIPPIKRVIDCTFKDTQLAELVFLDVEILDDQCFLCSSINKIFLPKSLKNIGCCAFDMADVKEIYYEGTEDEFYDINFNDSRINTKIVKFNARIQDMNLKYVKKEIDIYKDFEI